MKEILRSQGVCVSLRGRGLALQVKTCYVVEGYQVACSLFHFTE